MGPSDFICTYFAQLNNEEKPSNRMNKIAVFILTQLLYARATIKKDELSMVDALGNTVLHQALTNKASVGTVKLLAEADSSLLYKKNSTSDLPLHIALGQKDSEFVACIVEEMGGLQVCDKYGQVCWQCISLS